MSCSADLKLFKSVTRSLTLKSLISERVFVAVDAKNLQQLYFYNKKESAFHSG